MTQSSDPVLTTSIGLLYFVTAAAVWYVGADRVPRMSHLLRMMFVAWSMIVALAALTYSIVGPESVSKSRNWLAMSQLVAASVVTIGLGAVKYVKSMKTLEGFDERDDDPARSRDEIDTVSFYERLSLKIGMSTNGFRNASGNGTSALVFAYLAYQVVMVALVESGVYPKPIPAGTTFSVQSIVSLSALCIAMFFTFFIWAGWDNHQDRDYFVVAVEKAGMGSKITTFMALLPLPAILTFILVDLSYSTAFFNSDSAWWMHAFICVGAPVCMTAWSQTWATWFDFAVFGKLIFYQIYFALPSLFLMATVGPTAGYANVKYQPSTFQYQDVLLLQDRNATTIYTITDKKTFLFLQSVTAILATTVFWAIATYAPRYSPGKGDDLAKEMVNDGLNVLHYAMGGRTKVGKDIVKGVDSVVNQAEKGFRLRRGLNRDG